MPVFRYLLLPSLSASLLLFAVSGAAQDCSQASGNILCAENPATADSLYPNPFTYDCFSADMTYFFSFNTGSTPGGEVDVYLNPTDCDDFLGTSTFSVMLIELPEGSDACSASNYISNTPCFQDDQETTFSFTGLQPDSYYVLVLGSDHDTIYGPCNFEIGISGTAVDLQASVNPFLITLGESAEISVTGAETGAGYTWSPGETLDNDNAATTTATPEGTTTYIAESTIGACTVTDPVTITVGPPIVVYNTFTPNNDGFNDGWTIEGIHKFPDAQVTVYDRWGQKVFDSLGYGKPWDGTNRGKFLPTGAYYYVIELNSMEVNIPPINGVISIVR